MMNRIQQFSLKEVLPHIGKSSHKFWAKGKLYNVRMGTQRMLLLGRTQECACCGTKGHHFWLEHSGCRSPHFNLYGQDRHGNFVLMTMDHIVPKSKDGKTEVSNLQLFCTRCNRIKKNDQISIEELRKKAKIPVVVQKLQPPSA